MLKVDKSYKHYKIETNDVAILVLLENGIKSKIEELEYLIDNNLFEYRNAEIKKEIERYKEYLKIL